MDVPVRPRQGTMSAETRGAAVDAEVRGIQRGGTIGTRGVRQVYLGVGSSWS